MSELTFNYLPPTEKNRQTHMWTAVGERGGVHIHATPSPLKFHDEEFYGGIEVHSRKQVYVGDKEPSQAHCWLLDGPCWHDGSSLYFSENIEPMLRHKDGQFGDGIHEYMKTILAEWYRSHFEKEAA